MKNFIDGINFHDLEAMKYWSPPSTWSVSKRKEEFNRRVYSDEWFGTQKHDGAFYKFVKDEDGNMELLGRSKSVSGDYLNKIGHVPQLKEFFEALPNGTCLLGELYFPKNEGSKNTTTIMGCLEEKAIKRQEKGDKLYYFLFDCLAFKNNSFLGVRNFDRVDFLSQLKNICKCPYVVFPEIFMQDRINSSLQAILSAGYEGIVLLKKDGIYEPGKRPSKTTMKVKKELQDTVDCFFTGRASAPARLYTGKEIENWTYWQNTKTGEKIEGELYYEYAAGANLEPVTKSFFHGFAGSLEIGVMKCGEVYPIGWLSGLTEEIKKNYKDYKGRCIEVNAMMREPDTLALRHGKMVQFRDDLTPEDCTYEKFVGEN